MKVYLAGERWNGEWTKYIRRRLYSYYYHGLNNGNKPSREVKESVALQHDLFLDSGAFTAFTMKQEIDVDLYAEFIHTCKGIWSVCSSLDAIGEPEKSYEYFCVLKDLGCDVKPVFHAREDTKWLVKYLDEGHEYIFIGGMVPESTPWLMQWLDNLFTEYLCHSDGSPRVKLHGFGLTDQQLMFRYPWYSVDSTSWLMTGIFGECAFLTKTGLRKVVFSDSSPQAKNIRSWHYARLPPIVRKEVDTMLEEYGVTAEQCATNYMYRDIVNARTYQRMEQFGTTHFTKRVHGLF